MNVNIWSFAEKSIDPSKLMNLYQIAGWWEEREEKDIKEMLNQGASVGAWNGDQLIGFARAISDGKFRAYVEDVVVHREFQSVGIGANLVANLLHELSDIDVISLFCDEDLIPFYEKNNFKHSKSQFVMHRK
ncbi:Acetyltransferase (GNAT) domain-containing protein [Oceanobacillus limi]|uniref:Acetyltransferase (GNAT) domain-containing protein n=1 Tax=Oceanobacillus limi TaxID=930131 RepID=A0A1I0GLR1_9BACI|nr:GNAT family N-acetyltransferase [Oceanobacillus limi]SET71148.1 Acetyltransferase (GNAT) domain-containing protein [Oceanobacillus limi]